MTDPQRLRIVLWELVATLGYSPDEVVGIDVDARAQAVVVTHVDRATGVLDKTSHPFAGAP